MIILSVLSKPTATRTGFTLVELMIALTILAFGMAGAYTAISLLGKGSESVVSYAEMNGQSRKLLYSLGRDVRGAEDVKVANANRFEVVDLDGNRILYDYDANGDKLTRTENGDTQVILSNVAECRFRYYTFRQVETSRPVEVKHVQLQARMRRPILSITTSDDIVTARFMMRNHEVSN